MYFMKNYFYKYYTFFINIGLMLLTVIDLLFQKYNINNDNNNNIIKREHF